MFIQFEDIARTSLNRLEVQNAFTPKTAQHAEERKNAFLEKRDPDWDKFPEFQ